MSRQIRMIMQFGAVLLTCAAAALMPTVASGVPGPVTLYVSGTAGYDGPGTDSGTCTVESSPCASLAYALTQAASGDTIEVSGTVSEASAAEVDLNVTIQDNPDGTGATIQGTKADSNGLLIIGDNTVSIGDVTFQDGNATNGGAIASNSGGELTVNGSTFSDNTASNDGGAIDNNAGSSQYGSATVTNSTFTGNTASDAGGAIANNNSGGSHGSLVVADSTFTDNSSNLGGAIGNNFDGSFGSVTIADSTFSGNTASGDGGAIDNNEFAGNGGTTVVTASTLTANKAINGPAIDNNDNGSTLGTVVVSGDILDGSCASYLGADAGGVWTDDGYNAATDDSCVTGSSAAPASDAHDSVGPAAADLGTLADNGGPTQTIKPLAANPAIGLIPANTTVAVDGASTKLCPTTDQRGVSNAGASGCEAGAVQLPMADTTYVAGTGGVDTAAASDDNDCSVESTPCASIAGALTETTAAGTVELSGTLSESAAANVDQNVTIEDNPDGSGATIQGTKADSDGLLIIGDNTVSISDITFQDGNATNGGAIASNSGGELTVNGSTFSDNTAERNGGALDNNDNAGNGSLTVTNSTFTNNSAASDGGAIDNNDDGVLGYLTVTNSTLTDNSARFGGALDNNTSGAFGKAVVTASSLSSNSAVVSGANITNNAYMIATGGAVYVTADVLDGSCSLDPNGGTGGVWTDDGYNVATDDSCLTGDSSTAPASSADDAVGPAVADLGALADNGGPTQTIELLAGNPAINLIPATTSVEINGTNTQLCPGTDQRGVANPGGTGCDAGAVQWASQTVAFASATPTTATVGQTAATLTANSSSGLPVTLSLDSATTHSACTLSAKTVTFTHAGSCVLDANQAGNANFQAAPQVPQTITVSAAGTTTSLSDGNGTLTATVTPAAPGGGTPTGTVEFLEGAQIVGTGTLIGGTAALAYTAPAGSTQTITASYEGSADYLASASSTVTVTGPTVTATGPSVTVTPQSIVNPTITAALSSSRPETANGWWTTPVTITFACSGNGDTLASACPSPMVLDQSGPSQEVTETIRTKSGGTDTVAVTGIDIDLTRPRVRITGASSRHSYLLSAPHAHCRAAEAVSGIRSCRLTERTIRNDDGYQVRYTARATSIAGTTATSRLRIQVQTVDLLGATPITPSSYRVTPGTSYTLEVLSNTQPTYLDAAVSPLTPTPPHHYFRDAGRLDGGTLWTVRLSITPGFQRYTPWKIGFQMNGTTHFITLQT